MRSALWIMLLLVAGEVSGATLEPTGVIGNSGATGPSLVHCTCIATPGGVWIEEDLTLWLDGGDAINHLSFDGATVERFPLAPACELVQSPSFAALDGTLYFLGLAPPTNKYRTNNAALFRLPMRPDGAVELAARLPLTNPRSIGDVAPHPIDGRLLLALNREDPEDETAGPGLYTWSPQKKETGPSSAAGLQRFGQLRPERVAGVGIDPRRGWVYFGGYFGQYRPSFAHHPKVTEFVRLDRQGRELNRRDMFTMEAIPSQFNGQLSYAADALWAFAWYGFTGRMAPDTLASAPGKVTGWDLRLNQPSQVIGVRDVVALAEPSPQARRFDPLIITTNRPASTYYARWDYRHRRLELVDRLGSLPAVDSLALGEDGWLAVGVPDWQTWYRWEDGPRTPPRHAGIGSALIGGVYVEEMLIAIQRPRHGRWKPGEPADLTVNSFIHATGRHTSRKIAELPTRLPGGFDARVSPRPDGHGNSGTAYVVDAENGTLWQAALTVRGTQANVGRWDNITIGGGELNTPGDLAALGPDLLAVADGGHVVLLQRTAEAAFRVEQRLNGWSKDTEARFGGRLRLDGEGATLLVADTERHRVMWLDVPTQRVVARFGNTDEPGSDVLSLDGPTAITLAGRRAVVYDANNQRLVKLVLSD